MREPAGKAARSDEPQPDVAGASRGESGEEGVVVAPRDPRDMPVEPAAPWSETGEGFTDPAWDAISVHRQLLRFSAHGQRDESAAVVSDEFWPALLHPFRDLTRFRHDFPICLVDDHDDRAALTLTGLIDALLEEIDAEGDDGARLRRHLYQLESALGVLAEAEPGQGLSSLWDRAAADLIAASTLPAEKKEQLQDDLERARGVLAIDGIMTGCGPSVPRLLLEQSLMVHWRQHCDVWREEFERLVIGLEEMIRADDGHAPSAVSSTGLRNSVGRPDAEDVDFDRMSDILGRAHLGDPLPAARRKRLEHSLATIREMMPVFQGDAHRRESDESLKFSLAPIENDCALAAAECDRRLTAMVELFRASRIAELEIENHYRDDNHDAFFASFDATHLTEDELALCPPVLLYLDGASLTGADEQQLLGLLSSGRPIKVLLCLDTLFCEDTTTRGVVPAWPSRLASMATGLNDVFVLQCAVSRAATLEAGFRDGLSYPGTALFSVYTGTAEGHRRWPRFMDASAAVDSRAFPVFRFDPGRGETLADRMTLLENSDTDRDWPSGSLQYLTEDGTETGTELSFTLADYLCGDDRLSGHFWPVPPSLWHPEMRPLEAFLGEDPAITDSAIPCLVTITAEGQILRVVVSRAIVRAARSCAGRWRATQEAGGVNNSHALALLGREKERLEEEKAGEIARIEAQYAERLDGNIGDLTREIVGRIASQLVSGGTAPAPLAPAQTPPPAAVPPAGKASDAEAEPEPVAVAAEPEEEEEEFSLDEPYIDTPLCTTCDDCTTMSPQIFAYDENKQAYIKDAAAGTYRELVLAAEKCPVNIIHPGKPGNPDEPNLEEWIERAKPYL